MREVLIELWSGGAHCCFSTHVWRWGGTRYDEVVHAWGNATADVRDLDGDGTLEFLTGDDRFSYAFTDFADSFLPVRVLALDSGGFADVTAGHLDLVRRQEARYQRILRGRRRRGTRDTAGILAAWAADRATLGDRATARRRVMAFAPHADVSRRTAREIVRQLRAWGYLED